MSINDGGPAFPIAEAFDERTGNVTQYASNGMSLRDYFAAKAMQGFAADHEFSLKFEGMASLAYKWADAMLHQRSQ